MIRGRSAHAGRNPEEGRNAIVSLPVLSEWKRPAPPANPRGSPAEFKRLLSDLLVEALKAAKQRGAALRSAAQ